MFIKLFDNCWMMVNSDELWSIRVMDLSFFPYSSRVFGCVLSPFLGIVGDKLFLLLVVCSCLFYSLLCLLLVLLLLLLLLFPPQPQHFFHVVLQFSTMSPATIQSITKTPTKQFDNMATSSTIWQKHGIPTKGTGNCSWTSLPLNNFLSQLPYDVSVPYQFS